MPCWKLILVGCFSPSRWQLLNRGCWGKDNFYGKSRNSFWGTGCIYPGTLELRDAWSNARERRKSATQKGGSGGASFPCALLLLMPSPVVRVWLKEKKWILVFSSGWSALNPEIDSHLLAPAIKIHMYSVPERKPPRFLTRVYVAQHDSSVLSFLEIFSFRKGYLATQILTTRNESQIVGL